MGGLIQRRLHLTHYHTYPHTPKMNAHCERFNRTIQEEFLDYHAGSLIDPSSFNQQMIPWLVWYNTERPHWGLDLKSPMQFMLTHSSAHPEQSNMRWTDTMVFFLEKRMVKLLCHITINALILGWGI